MATSCLSPVHLLLVNLLEQLNTSYQQENFQALLAAQLSQEKGFVSKSMEVSVSVEPLLE